MSEEDEALAAMAAANVLTVYRDAATGAAVLLHVHQPERFWDMAKGLLPPPDAAPSFWTRTTDDGWGWAQCLYQEEDVGERPWMCRETFPADPVGALYAREFTLVWRFRHPPALQRQLMDEALAFLSARPPLMVDGGLHSLSPYLNHALPLGTEVRPYGTLLWYLRLEYLASNNHIRIEERSACGRRPLVWRIDCARAVFCDAFPKAFSHVPEGALRHNNWLGLPFLSVDGKTRTVPDLLREGDAFFAARPLVTHLPRLEPSRTPPPERRDLLDLEVFKQYNAQWEVKKKRGAQDDQPEDAPGPSKPVRARTGRKQ